ncbi:MAG: hypothetical protein GXP25_17690 [Planctomycetes bacterium]|nr:hypothetical protein [Planctomycetota bacterium]
MTEEDNEPRESVDYELPESHLQVRGECLVKTTDKGVPMSSVQLSEIRELTVGRSVHWGNVLFGMILLGMAAAAFYFIRSEGWRWGITIVVGLLGLIVLMIVLDTLLTVKTNYGSLRFQLKDERDDIDAFLLTLERLRKRR